MKTTIVMIVLLCFQPAASQTDPDGSTASLRQQGEHAARYGDFDAAINAYQKAYELDGRRDTELVKRIATLYSWKRDFSGARDLLGTIVDHNPTDGEAAASLQELDMRRGLQVSGSYGEGEIDYTRSVFTIHGFYGGLDWLDLHTEYSRSSKPFYDRSELSFDAYYFPTYRTYLRLGFRQKNYTYPSSVQVAPDNNAYAAVPDYQIELGHYYAMENYLSIEFEYFTPHFFWNNSLRAHNYKIGASVRQWIGKPLYAKLFGAVLHDPDPASLVLASPTTTISSFAYENLTLVGGALGFDNNRVNAEVKFIPDRDLDRSLQWSLFATLAVTMNDMQLRYDFLYDQYPKAKAFPSSQVHIASVQLHPWPFVDTKVGVKTIIQNVTMVVPFVALQFNSGI
jgi:tetratricopeptide (TPR) repeat protein